MPQMSPLMWLNLYFYTMLLLLLMMIMLYFLYMTKFSGIHVFTNKMIKLYYKFSW